MVPVSAASEESLINKAVKTPNGLIVTKGYCCCGEASTNGVKIIY